eukprot:15364849-Ditylum_brightwellii.AAC.1
MMQQWNEINFTGTVRGGAAAVSLGESIVVMGGNKFSSAELSSAEQYNSTTGQWSAFSSMKKARCAFAAALLNWRIIVAGGWRDAAVINGQRYVVGGYDSDKRLSSAEITVVGGHDGNTHHAAYEAYNPTAC